MIDVRKLVKRYGTHTAVDHLSFEAQAGEIVGLLGPNGAGKTTTMRILTGFMPPTSGHVRVGGYDVLEDSLAVRQRVGYMPERVPVYPDMTLRAYVTYWARLRGMRRPAQRVNEMLERFGLAERHNQLVRSLSKGLRQRLGLAQALVHNPDVIILDEPTIGIDPEQVITVREMVRSLRGEHTVLFSSHILSEVEQICDRVVILNQGKVVASGTTQLLSRQLRPGLHLYVSVAAKSQQAQTILEALPGVQAVKRQDGGFIVSSEDDVRAAVNQALTLAGLTLTEMRQVEITLEDIFLQLMHTQNQTRT